MPSLGDFESKRHFNMALISAAQTRSVNPIEFCRAACGTVDRMSPSENDFAIVSAQCLHDKGPNPRLVILIGRFCKIDWQMSK